MSFILDALKKSEAERQRQAGPTLLEVRITRPRRRYPLWAAIVGGLLGVNVVVLVVFLLHRPTPLAERSTESPPAAGAPAVASATAPPALGTAAPASTSAAPGAPPAVSLPGNSGGLAKAADGSSTGDRYSGNPADNEPAVTASGVRVEQPSANNYANLPGIDQLGNVPALRLDLLDYSDRVSERYALINMHRVRAGDVLPEGPKVLAITRDGVALDYQGQDFMLRPTAP